MNIKAGDVLEFDGYNGQATAVVTEATDTSLRYHYAGQSYGFKNTSIVDKPKEINLSKEVIDQIRVSVRVEFLERDRQDRNEKIMQKAEKYFLAKGFEVDYGIITFSRNFLHKCGCFAFYTYIPSDFTGVTVYPCKQHGFGDVDFPCTIRPKE